MTARPTTPWLGGLLVGALVLTGGLAATTPDVREAPDKYGTPDQSEPAPHHLSEVAIAEDIETIRLGTLASTDAFFWDGPHIESSGGPQRDAYDAACASNAATMFACFDTRMGAQPTAQVEDFFRIENLEPTPSCDSGHIECFVHEVELATDGTFHVASDTQTERDVVYTYVYGPDGTYRDKLRVHGGRAKWLEAEAGTWTLLTMAYSVRDAMFRLRAALDPVDGPYIEDGDRWVPACGKKQDKPCKGKDKQPKEEQRPMPDGVPDDALLPNLQVIPPFELGFAGCQATEIADYGARNCLRFSSGPANVGDGPLDLVIDEELSTAGQGHQRIHRTDGDPVLIDGGQYEWHAEHVHYHHDAIAALELYRVTANGLVAAGVGPKLGFCMGPYTIAEWHSFTQDDPASVYTDTNCGGIDAPQPTQMALARGWTDIYGRVTEGNYLEFGDNPDGEYVLRVSTDPDNGVLELRDDDNISYAYFRVDGDDIQVFERGIGRSHLDPDRIVTHDILRPVAHDPLG